MKLELRGITKRFGSLVANNQIDLLVKPGQIHGLLGENGAGKSTLMNVLYGLYQPDAGEILLDDKPQRFAGPGDAMSAGIGMVHQHFMLIPVFSVAENVVLGNEPQGRGGTLDIAAARQRVRDISERFGFEIDPDAKIEDLSVGTQQRVEIVKALSREAKVLVLDEPTAVLTPQETDELMAIMRQLSASGTSIIFITHKLREVKAVCDEITVIRQGQVIETVSPKAELSKLASLMVGREVDLQLKKPAAKAGDVLLRAEDLIVQDDRQQTAVNGVSLEVRAGEILGIAGVQGNGQTELAEAILALRPIQSGRVWVGELDVTPAGVRKVLEAGVGFVPEDRKKDGLVAEFTVAENLMLNGSFVAPFAKGIALDLKYRSTRADQLVAEYDIRTTSADNLVSKLSGGNQQKVVLARELSRETRVLIASQPTRGVDVGSIEFIHEKLIQERAEGRAILLISSELDEIVALSDRIAVMYRGKIVAVVTPDTARATLGKLMAGVTQ